MNKASTEWHEEEKKGDIPAPKWLSFRSTSIFSAGFFKNHCGPTAITNLIISALQAERGEAVPDRECESIFETVAGLGMKRLFYNFRFGTTDLLLPFFVRAAFRLFGVKLLRTGRRHFISPKKIRRSLSKGSFAYMEVFSHPDYGWHQWLIYDTAGDEGFLAADGRTSGPVIIKEKDLGKGLFLEILAPQGLFISSAP